MAKLMSYKCTGLGSASSAFKRTTRKVDKFRKHKEAVAAKARASYGGAKEAYGRAKEEFMANPTEGSKRRLDTATRKVYAIGSKASQIYAATHKSGITQKQEMMGRAGEVTLREARARKSQHKILSRQVKGEIEQREHREQQVKHAMGEVNRIRAKGPVGFTPKAKAEAEFTFGGKSSKRPHKVDKFGDRIWDNDWD